MILYLVKMCLKSFYESLLNFVVLKSLYSLGLSVSYGFHPFEVKIIRRDAALRLGGWRLTSKRSSKLSSKLCSKLC